ncbi:MAG TPA: succinylglutamate desuccinylase/aspartoacylase family protein [Candidatus Dormibacteraeota bacterium]|nr:succinylglutamate desuccinylase/aspartoacylase family protein [Candidatus Dormibacteraeota bacterium]
MTVDSAPLNSRRAFRFPVATMPDGSTLSIPVNVITGSRRHPRLIAVAGHHGDEQEGPAALITLWHRLQPKDLRGSVVMIPVLNPPAFQALRRISFEDGLDINRVFPGSPTGTITERLADALCGHLLEGADLILSMHGWTAGYLVEPYVEYPRSGSVSEKSRRAAVAFGLGFVNPLEAGPGRLLTVASDMGFPVIEVEIGGQASSLPERRVLYEEGTLNLLRHLGALGGRGKSHPQAQAIDRVEVFAPAGGLLRAERPVGAPVRRGEKLAAIHDLNLALIESIVSPVTGVVGVMRLAANVLPGQLVATVFAPL